jgi:hypothetical protein
VTQVALILRKRSRIPKFGSQRPPIYYVSGGKMGRRLWRSGLSTLLSCSTTLPEQPVGLDPHGLLRGAVSPCLADFGCFSRLVLTKWLRSSQGTTVPLTYYCLQNLSAWKISKSSKTTGPNRGRGWEKCLSLHISPPDPSLLQVISACVSFHTITISSSAASLQSC